MTLSVGDRAPDFTLVGTDESITLSSILARQNVVLFFYPKDDTLGCTREACAFRDRHAAFETTGARLLGISADSVDSHKLFAERHQLPMTLLSDPGGKVRALYQVEATLGLLPGRATFVIDTGGIIRYTLASQLRFERHAEEALRVAQSLAAP